jgi:cyclic di-GMP phosphodiesterase
MPTVVRNLDPLERAAVDSGPSGFRVLVVEDETLIRDILVRKLKALGYECDSCENGQAALNLLPASTYDLILTDLMMPEMGGLSLLRETRALCPDTAVILVTSVSDLSVAVEALTHGAYDYILKPFSLQEVSVIVARALEKRRLLLENRRYQQHLEEEVASQTQQFRDALELLKQTYHSTLVALGTALDSRDADSEGHALRVTLYTLRLARQVGSSGADLKTIEQGALLHDIGKIGIPDDLLRKAEKLSESEWQLMRRHPEIGYRILSRISFLREAARMVLHHQERYDGEGYPAGLKSDEIALSARIFAVADTLDCMTTDRPFQKAVTFETAREEIIRVAGTQLDPAIVSKFLEIPLDEWKTIVQEIKAKAKAHKPVY